MRLYKHSGWYSSLGGNEYLAIEYYITDENKRKLYWSHNISGPWHKDTSTYPLDDDPKNYYDFYFFGLFKKQRECPYTYIKEITLEEIKDQMFVEKTVKVKKNLKFNRKFDLE